MRLWNYGVLLFFVFLSNGFSADHDDQILSSKAQFVIHRMIKNNSFCERCDPTWMHFKVFLQTNPHKTKKNLQKVILIEKKKGQHFFSLKKKLPTFESTLPDFENWLPHVKKDVFKDSFGFVMPALVLSSEWCFLDVCRYDKNTQLQDFQFWNFLFISVPSGYTGRVIGAGVYTVYRSFLNSIYSLFMQREINRFFRLSFKKDKEVLVIGIKEIIEKIEQKMVGKGYEDITGTFLNHKNTVTDEKNDVENGELYEGR